MDNISSKLLEAIDSADKSRKSRQSLALRQGKKFRTPNNNELRISVLDVTVNTETKESSLYISCYVGDQNFQCHSTEELVDIYLNN